MIAIQRRSHVRHLVHPDGLATYCGRILHRRNWRLLDLDEFGSDLGEVYASECKQCVGLIPFVLKKAAA